MKRKILYLCVHKRLCEDKRLHEKIKEEGIIKTKKFLEVLGELYHIPKKFKVLVLKEMISFNMIEKIDRNNLKVLPLEYDPEEHLNELYKEYGLF